LSCEVSSPRTPEHILDKHIHFAPEDNFRILDVKLQLPREGDFVLSQTVEYALRAVVFLASQSGQSKTNEQISTATKVPAAYLSKVLQALGRAGLVQAHRGVRGGFSLAKEADDLTILAVVNAVDPIQRIRTCPLGLKAHGVRLCPLHARLDDALAKVEQAFADTTLAEVLAEPTTSIPLCEFPSATEPNTSVRR
jgi:Rrf2 family protein